MENQYVAKSRRISLRRLKENDFDFFFELFNNHRAMEFLPEHRTAEKTKAWIVFNFDHYCRYGYGKWVIENSNGDLMGHCGLIHTMIDGVDSIELGYFLHPNYWHQGFATEAAGLAMKLGFEEYDLERLVSAINPANKPSVKVAERLGMKKEKEGIASVGAMSWICNVYTVNRK